MEKHTCTQNTDNIALLGVTPDMLGMIVLLTSIVMNENCRYYVGHLFLKPIRLIHILIRSLFSKFSWKVL